MSDIFADRNIPNHNIMELVAIFQNTHRVIFNETHIAAILKDKPSK